MQDPNAMELAGQRQEFEEQDLMDAQWIGQPGAYGQPGGGNYGDYQTTILEEAASNEEDMDPHHRE